MDLVPAQTHRVTDPNANLWLSHWGDHRCSERWSFHTEAHWRRADLGQRWQQLLVRPAVNFHLKEQVTLSAGYSYYANHSYGEYPIRFRNWEHQSYQQIQLSQALGGLRVQLRFRMEERFIARLRADEAGRSEFDGYNYQNRFRFRVWVTIPLSKSDSSPFRRFTGNFYDEVFLSFGNAAQLDHIQQNRISALIGYQPSDQLNILAGYLYQSIQRPGAALGADLMELNSTIHLAFVYDLDLRKKSGNKG